MAQNLDLGANASARQNGRPGGVGGPDKSSQVEVASPDDLSIIPLGELSDARVSAGADRLLDALAMEDAILSNGIIAGGFDIRPAIDMGAIVTDNADGGLDRESALGVLIAPELVASSRWARHQIGMQARGSYLSDFQSNFVEESAFATLGGRLDLAPGSAVGGTVGYGYSSTGLEDEIVPTGAPRPGTRSLDARLRFGRQSARWAWAANLTGQRNYFAFEDGSGTDRTGEARLSLRVARKLGDGVAAFGEARLVHLAKASGTRLADDGVSGEAQGLVGGLRIDATPALVAEIALGLRRERLARATTTPDADRVRPVFDATVIWAPVEQLRVRFGANAAIKTSGLQPAFARAVQAWRLAVEGRPSDTLRVSAGVGFAGADVIGIARQDRTASVFALADRDLSKTVAILARYDFERTKSDAIGVGQAENRVTIAVRFRL